MKEFMVLQNYLFALWFKLQFHSINVSVIFFCCCCCCCCYSAVLLVFCYSDCVICVHVEKLRFDCWLNLVLSPPHSTEYLRNWPFNLPLLKLVLKILNVFASMLHCNNWIYSLCMGNCPLTEILFERFISPL